MKELEKLDGIEGLIIIKSFGELIGLDLMACSMRDALQLKEELKTAIQNHLPKIDNTNK